VDWSRASASSVLNRAIARAALSYVEEAPCKTPVATWGNDELIVEPSQSCFAAQAFPDPSRRFTRAVLGALLRDLSHINIRLPGIVSLSTSRGDFNMRKFILIAGFVLASAAAQA